jgi:L-histidine N-alpha-methyltransferase
MRKTFPSSGGSTRGMSLPGAVHRLTFQEIGLASADGDFAKDIREGLTSSPKRLEPRYLYDEIGAALYDAIVLLPEYYLTAAETEILTRHAGDVVALTGSSEIAELGPGNGQKTRILLDAALRRHAHVTYRPVDISRDALQNLSQQLVSEYDRLSVMASCGDYLHALRSRSLRGDGTTLLLFLGSSLGNYDPRSALALMRAIAAALRPGDSVLLGVDLKKSREMLELAYDDPGGVTAAFNRNVLVRINRELGGNFEFCNFRFVVHYDERRGCVDSFQESTVDQRLSISSLGLDVALARGERILTESSYKYSEEDVHDLAGASGFSVEAAWNDAARRFLVALLTLR